MNIVLLSFHQHLLASKPPHTIIMADILQVFFVAHRVRSFFSHFLSFFENRQTRKYLNWIEAFLLILCLRETRSSPTQFCCNALFWIALKDNEQILSDWNFYRITDYCPDWYLHGDEEKEREWKKHKLWFTIHIGQHPMHHISRNDFHSVISRNQIISRFQHRSQKLSSFRRCVESLMEILMCDMCFGGTMTI